MQQGRATKETGTAIKEAISELARNANEMEQMQAEIANVTKLTQAIVLQGQRRRAQVAGGRQ